MENKIENKTNTETKAKVENKTNTETKAKVENKTKTKIEDKTQTEKKIIKKQSIKSVIFMEIIGFALNMTLVGLTNIFQLPIYLDSIGTIIVASLCGYLPGISVGFFSNLAGTMINVSPDPMTMYYGFISTLIAVVAVIFSKKGLLLKWRGRVSAWITFAFVGGGIGACVTWILYGFSFGEGASSGLVHLMYEKLKMPPFIVQLTADFGVDLLDKAICMLGVCIILKLIPDNILSRLPYGHIYFKNKSENENSLLSPAQDRYLKKSVNKRIIFWTSLSTSLISVAAVIIGGYIYYNEVYKQFLTDSSYISQMMSAKINGTQMANCLENECINNVYSLTTKDLEDIIDNEEHISAMSIYQMEEDGMHMILSVENDNHSESKLGDIHEYGKAEKQKKKFITGQNIENIIDKSGGIQIMKVYSPVESSIDNIFIYTEVVMDMSFIKTKLAIFLVRVITLLFGLVIFISNFTIWVCNKYLLEPIGILTEQARRMVYDGNKQHIRVRDQYAITTGDELEEVFRIMCQTEDKITNHVTEMEIKNHEISKMQRNIIFALANMVENRDANTGGHIKRTAYYVRLIGKTLLQNGIYPEIVTNEYVKCLYNSAPLHDIGKIKISDMILNKPGKFTDEEFNIMKTHTIEGKRILTNSLSDIEDASWLSMAVDMAMYHHEKWNGTGYPEGKKGDKIPLCSRIMAVADVFDALVSKRSYKNAFTYEKAFQIIKEGSGEHFDPLLVEAFFECEEQIRIIMEQTV